MMIKIRNLFIMDTLYLVSLKTVFANYYFNSIHHCLDPWRTMFIFFQSNLLLNECLNLITVIGLKPYISSITTIPMFLLNLLNLTPNLKPASLVWKSYPKVKVMQLSHTFTYLKYVDLFITYKERFTLPTGNRNPLKFPEDGQYDTLSTHLISVK